MACDTPLDRSGLGMGFDFGLQNLTTCFPTKNRWLFSIENVSAGSTASGVINCLPPSKSARPSLSFKEIEIKHLTESVFYPIKPEWKPVDLVLYDIKGSNNPVFNWISRLYSPQKASWNPTFANQNDNFYQTATLALYSGCGDVIETWIFENCWPKDVDWGDLDMGNVEVLTAKVTLRYARAYLCQDSFQGI